MRERMTKSFCAATTHNLVRWTAHLEHVVDAGHRTVTRTIRRQLLAVPRRLVNRFGHLTLRTPARWPWAHTTSAALKTIRALPPAPTRPRHAKRPRHPRRQPNQLTNPWTPTPQNQPDTDQAPSTDTGRPAHHPNTNTPVGGSRLILRASGFTYPPTSTTDAPSHSNDIALSSSTRRMPHTPNASCASLRYLRCCQRPPGSTSPGRW